MQKQLCHQKPRWAQKQLATEMIIKLTVTEPVRQDSLFASAGLKDNKPRKKDLFVEPRCLFPMNTFLQYPATWLGQYFLTQAL